MVMEEQLILEIVIIIQVTGSSHIAKESIGFSGTSSQKILEMLP